ncbi:MAG TPA: MYXO-CTERM sorting domain-containing protein [Kofleriaceae bacterium]|jgi:hypothetical protein|nr:MYXO-CTERM sorting domain-containing protein [Kofleriaceae bacterium]
MRAAWSVVLAVACLPAVVTAQPEPRRAIDYVVVEPPPPSGLWHAGPAVVYLNRCAAGCSVRAGGDDAVADTSSILGRTDIPRQVSIEPFAWDQATWDGMVACVRDVYALYDVHVVTEPPAGPHVEVMVAGTAAALNLPSNTLGIAPLANDCSRIPSAVAFAFANAHEVGDRLITELCATTAHEAGHVFGLDHEFDCRDPMTYLAACGPKVFLNRTVECGEFDGPRPCKCAARQSSHLHLTDVIGPGALPSPAEISVLAPTPGAVVPPTFSVFVEVAGRPAATVELWANGAKLDEQPGKQTTAPYLLRTQASLPDGVLDLEVRVYDDLGQLAVARLTVQKGAPCADASACPSGWACDGGRCLAPAGDRGIGDDCAVDGDCASGQCAQRAGATTCSQPCWPTGAACPNGLACVTGDDEGFACFADDGGGCCSAGGDGRGPLGLALVVGLALFARPRRATPGTDR